MAKISEYTTANALTGAELVVLVQGGSTYKTNTQAIANLAPAGGVPPTGTGFRHITAGSEDAAAKLVVDADVNASANIAITKLASNVASTDASQTLTNKTFNVSDNDLTSTSGALGDILKHNGTKFVRLARGSDTQVLTSNATDVYWAAASGGGTPGGSSGQLQFNDASSFGGTTGFTYASNTITATTNAGVQFGNGTSAALAPIRFGETGTADNCYVSVDTGAGLVPVFSMGTPAVLRILDTTNWNGLSLLAPIEAYTLGSSTFYGGGALNFTTSSTGLQLGTGSVSHGSGIGVVGVTDCSAAPSTNPAGGGVMYSDSGALKWRGSGGTVTTMGPADPHCPTCGRDFAVEHRNDNMGEHLALCLPCLVDALAVAGVNTAAFSIADTRSRTKAEWDSAHAQAKARSSAFMAEDRANVPRWVK
jgi:hypothetical protein